MDVRYPEILGNLVAMAVAPGQPEVEGACRRWSAGACHVIVDDTLPPGTHRATYEGPEWALSILYGADGLEVRRWV